MSANTYINLAVQMLQRNNPVLEVVGRIQALIQFIVTYKSDAKLHKFRHSLYMQQLNRMEGFISEGSPYQYRGDKIDRKF